MAEVIYWLGDASETSASVCVRVDTAGSYTLRCNGQVSAPQALDPASGFGIGRFDVNGLQSDSFYPFEVLLSGVAQVEGALRTIPGDGQSFHVAFISCWRQSGDPAVLYKLVRDYDVRAVFGIGDLPYLDAQLEARWVPSALPGVYTAPGSVDTWNNQYLALHRDVPAFRYMFERVPFYRMWDDHDSLGNDFDHELTRTNAEFTGNGGSAFANQAALDAAFNRARQAFDLWSVGNPASDWPFAAPWKPAAADASTSINNYPPQYFSKVLGVAQFHVIDPLSHRSTTAAADGGDLIENAASAKTMLGRPQIRGLKAKLVSSPYLFNPIISPKVTMKGATTSDNNGFSDCPTERNHLLDWIGRYARGVVWGSGDVHTAFVINDEQHALVNGCSLNWAEQTTGGPDLGVGYVEGYAWKIQGYQRADRFFSHRNAVGLIKVTPNYLDWILVDEAGVEHTRWRQYPRMNTLVRIA